MVHISRKVCMGEVEKRKKFNSIKLAVERNTSNAYFLLHKDTFRNTDEHMHFVCDVTIATNAKTLTVKWSDRTKQYATYSASVLSSPPLPSFLSA